MPAADSLVLSALPTLALLAARLALRDVPDVAADARRLEVGAGVVMVRRLAGERAGTVRRA